MCSVRNVYSPEGLLHPSERAFHVANDAFLLPHTTLEHLKGGRFKHLFKRVHEQHNYQDLLYESSKNIVSFSSPWGAMEESTCCCNDYPATPTRHFPRGTSHPTFVYVWLNASHCLYMSQRLMCVQKITVSCWGKTKQVQELPEARRKTEEGCIFAISQWNTTVSPHKIIFHS